MSMLLGASLALLILSVDSLAMQTLRFCLRTPSFTLGTISRRSKAIFHLHIIAAEPSRVTPDSRRSTKPLEIGSQFPLEVCWDFAVGEY